MESKDKLYISNIDQLKQYPDKRNCYKELMEYIQDDSVRICALYGLRRTGKTVLLNQLAKEMVEKGEKCLYISCSYDLQKDIGPKINDFLDQLQMAVSERYSYVFVDEMTYIKELQGQGAVLSDYYGAQGLKIVATGTDSLNYYLSEQEALYDRVKLIHTSYVSFEEYNRLLGKGMDQYIIYGGTLKKESPYKDKISMEKYTNTSIVNNIIHSLKNSETGQKPLALTELYDKNILTSAINRCINQMNQQFTMNALRKVYESGPLHTGINNMAPYYPYARYVDIEKADQIVKERLQITDEFREFMKPEHLDAIKDYLQDLDLLQIIPSYVSLNPKSGLDHVELVTQAGMVYCHATELIKALTDSDMWKENCGQYIKKEFMNRVDRQVKGYILENTILIDLYQNFPECYVSKLTVSILPQDREQKNQSIDVMIKEKNDIHICEEREFGTKEADVIVKEHETGDVYLFEIKYSESPEDTHTKNLRNEHFINYVKTNFGNVAGRFVIYMGEQNRIKDDMGCIDFVNAETFLKEIPHAHSFKELADKMKFDSVIFKEFTVVNENPFKTYQELDNWKVMEESRISAVRTEKLTMLDKLWTDGLNSGQELITRDEYITRKKILCSEKDYQLGKLQERYLRYKDCIKGEPDIEQTKALHQSIKI